MRIGVCVECLPLDTMALLPSLERPVGAQRHSVSVQVAQPRADTRCMRSRLGCRCGQGATPALAEPCRPAHRRVIRSDCIARKQRHASHSATRNEEEGCAMTSALSIILPTSRRRATAQCRIMWQSSVPSSLHALREAIGEAVIAEGWECGRPARTL